MENKGFYAHVCYHALPKMKEIDFLSVTHFALIDSSSSALDDQNLFAAFSLPWTAKTVCMVIYKYLLDSLACQSCHHINFYHCVCKLDC